MSMYSGVNTILWSMVNASRKLLATFLIASFGYNYRASDVMYHVFFFYLDSLGWCPGYGHAVKHVVLLCDCFPLWLCFLPFSYYAFCLSCILVFGLSSWIGCGDVYIALAQNDLDVDAPLNTNEERFILWQLAFLKSLGAYRLDHGRCPFIMSVKIILTSVHWSAYFSLSTHRGKGLKLF